MCILVCNYGLLEIYGVNILLYLFHLLQYTHLYWSFLILSMDVLQAVI